MAEEKKDSPKAAKRRAHDKRVVSQMIAIYCHDNHKDQGFSRKAHCGEMICEECGVIDDYAVMKTQRCRNIETKISCEECPNHCYTKQERETIRSIMRYSGPRMMFHHPIEAIRHMMGK